MEAIVRASVRGAVTGLNHRQWRANRKSFTVADAAKFLGLARKP
jgi:hypothetical protein